MFGQSLHLDLYDCDNTDNLESCYRFLEELVYVLGMTQAGSVYLVHGPTAFDGTGCRQDVFPDKAGVSGFVPLIESGISIHTLNPTKFITLDIYSCKPITVDLQINCVDLCGKYFGYSRYEKHFLERGKEYAKESFGAAS